MVKETILVTGATGKQGGAVIKNLISCVGLNANLRIFVRDASSPSVKKLAASGVEIAVGSMEDQDSIEASLKGDDRVFLLTMFNLSSGEKPLDEARRGKNFVDAMVKSNSLKQVIFSTLPLGDNYYEAIGKHEVQQALISASLPLTTVSPTFYLENFLDVWPAVRINPEDSKNLTWGWLPSTKPLVMPSISLNDFGVAVAALFAEPVEQNLGRQFTLTTVDLPITDFCQKLSKAVGANVSYEPISQNVLENLPFPESVIEAFRYYGSVLTNRSGDSLEFFKAALPGPDSVQESIRQTNMLCAKKTQSVDDWIQQNQKELSKNTSASHPFSIALAHANKVTESKANNPHFLKNGQVW